MSVSEFKVPKINLNRNYLKQKTAAELQAIDQFIATFSVFRYMREKAVAATVAKVSEVVNNTVDAMDQICVTE